ncbi:uncharacterized protein BDZ99DRAFT_567348 [Mytilinidion resinicola]|uniref:Nephrocystin 3-like N-terminal domain-containing protein n=1 Tax=Mytilinidion resinicola TaxID=574789 RepID=A0A6A6Z5I7_9PEZI|nr:uncharacterized protein BDZ99DRAFT_567348 [Mytilinidion resinicola]KAF2815517.1 hypothetical protein BDZ99DRAFT_567348 [Mytilinidion resinicola]
MLVDLDNPIKDQAKYARILAWKRWINLSENQVSNNRAAGSALQVNAPVGRDVIKNQVNFGPTGQSAETDQERCRKALSKTNPYSNHGYQNIITDRGNVLNGTCRWIEEDDDFREWRRQSDKILWIRGGPGKGETFLSIHLTEYLKGQHLRQPLIGLPRPLVLTFFCSYANIERTVSVFVVRSLLAQLPEADGSLYEDVPPAFRDHEARKDDLFSNDNQEAMWGLVVKMLGRVKWQVYLVLDGPDECEDASINFLQIKLQHLYSTVTKA